MYKLYKYFKNKRTYDKFLLFSLFLFFTIAGAFLILHKAPFTPDQFFVVAFLIAIALGKGVLFLRDWTPVILMILIYEYLRGLIPDLARPVHYDFMIKFDRFLFGQLPGSYLQQNLFASAAQLHWYDYLSAILYMSHYVVPLFIAFWFWFKDKRYFEKYTIGIIGLSYLGFFTYLLYPAAPPWMASQAGLINPPLQHLGDVIFSHFFSSVSLPTVYKYLGANLVAAVPSLHVAYALMTSLFLYKKYPKFLPVISFYFLGICFAVLYLGDHYVFDALLGAFYAVIAFKVVMNWKKVKIGIWLLMAKLTFAGKGSGQS